MNRAKVLLIIVSILSGVSVSNTLNIVYVDVNSPNDPGTGSYVDPFRRIQHAIDSADVASEANASLVNFLDWVVFAAAWQSTPSSPNWNISCDIFPENGDGIVDIDDLATFMDQWLQLEVYSADIAPGGGDGIVNMLDFAVFAENWLWQQE